MTTAACTPTTARTWRPPRSASSRSAAGERFIRIHRSYLVNLAKVASVRRAGPDRLRLVLDDAPRTQLDVARRQSARVRSALKLG